VEILVDLLILIKFVTYVCMYVCIHACHVISIVLSIFSFLWKKFLHSGRLVLDQRLWFWAGLVSIAFFFGSLVVGILWFPLGEKWEVSLVPLTLPFLSLS
jgi:hypothetical protein